MDVSCVLSRFGVAELTRSILDTLCLRRRRLCLRISCEEELCSVELLSLRQWRGQVVTMDSGAFSSLYVLIFCFHYLF